MADYDRDGFLDVYVVRMGDHEKTRPGARTSRRATASPGSAAAQPRRRHVRATSREPPASSTRGWGLAGAWGDYDGDGWPDLYVANEFGGNAPLPQPAATARSRTSPRAAGVTDGGAGMGVAWGDYDADGDLDLYVSNMHANSRWALFHPDFPLPIPW